MDEKYIIAHDLGTSGDKAVLVSVTGEIIDSVRQDYPIYHPEPDYAEQDPEDLWRAVCTTTRAVLQKTGISADRIAGLTFSSQMQGLIPVDGSGSPLRRCITWLDGRSAEIVRQTLWTPPRVSGYNIFKLLRFLYITGGSPGHTGKDQIGKLLWLRHHEPEIFARAEKFLDVKDMIIFRLTGSMITSVDVAVIWWLLDTRNNRNEWHPGLCKLAGISPEQLAEVRESAAIAGRVSAEAAAAVGLPEGTPVINGAGDLSSAALGSGAIDDGELHICIGTSSWVAGHFRQRKVDITHYAGCIGSTNPKEFYLAMAHQETAGVCLDWLKRTFFGQEHSGDEETESALYHKLSELAQQAPAGCEGLIFLPWMFGERCPVDDDYIRAGFVNLGLNHGRSHLVRAVFEGVALNTRWALQTLEKLYHPVEELRMIGGGANSDLWCQIMADVTNRNIHRVQAPQQAGARAVALLASMALGYINSWQEIGERIKIERTFYPQPENRELYDRRFSAFTAFYKQNKKWFAGLNR